jgi:hypothetical protein
LKFINKKEQKEMGRENIKKSMNKDSSYQLKLLSCLMILIFLNLPFTFALQLNEISSSEVSENSALISWTSDIESSSAVYYGQSSTDLNLIESNSNTVSEHEVELLGLDSGVEYFYYIESETANDSIIDDNFGEYYSFTTDEEIPDTSTLDEEFVSDESADEIGAEGSENAGSDGESESEIEDDIIGLTVEFDEYVGTENIDIAVTAADNSELRVYVNGGYFAKDTINAEATGTGTLTFRSLPLEKNQNNEIIVEAVLEDIEEIYIGTVFMDATHPSIFVQPINEFVEENSVTISGTASEEVYISIKVNGEYAVEESSEIGSQVSMNFSKPVNLDEGDNTIIVVATDLGGLSVSETIRVNSDTKAPTVEAELSKGNEYYQNRAETDIFGTTEAGAEVYLFVYRPQTSDYTADFDDALQKVTADSNGEFTFSEVDFENEAFSLESLAPQQVPAGLEEITIKGVGQIESADDYIYYIYIIAEDASGKSGYYKDSVTVHSCYSQNLDFQIMDIAKYQSPLRLDPTLMDDGREIISAVFTMDYAGSGSSQVDVSTGEVQEKAYQINYVNFEKACTQGMLDDEKFNLGCTVLGNNPDKQLYNSDQSSQYLTWNLMSSEDLSDRDTEFWNDLKKRLVVFPIKVTLNYQERDATGSLSESKTQTSCYDLSYFVDVPVDSEEYIPDWLADEGVNALNVTIEKIDKVLPYLEKAIMVTGGGCVTSFLGKIAARFLRIASSNVEAIGDKFSDSEYKCLEAKNQWGLYLDDTIESWRSIEGVDNSIKDRIADYESGYNAEDDKNTKSLDDTCESTAALWKKEALLEQAYKWTCDRVFCRAVPAKWTESKETYEIESVILEQQQCSVSGSCVPLREQENCREYVEDKRGDLTVAQDLSNQLEDVEISGGTCWWKDDEAVLTSNSRSTSLYYFDESEENNVVNEDNGVYRLTKIGTTFAKPGETKTSTILALKEGDSYCGVRDDSCSKICKNSKAGDYKAYESDNNQGYGYKVNTKTGEVVNNDASGSCFKEVDGKLKNVNGEDIRGDQFAAGYTNDCFLDNEGEKYQCVCELDEEEKSKSLKGAREAIPAIKSDGASEEIREEFIYRQDRIYKESSRLIGTYYPSERYYQERDFSGAFGQDYLLDYLSTDENKRQHEVNPNTQYIGTFQSVCLSGIRANLVVFRSILDGLRSCINEAKYTGLQDAGMCKTIFTQHVCGLVYKAISYFSDSCTPYGFSDKENEKGVLGDQIKATFGSIEPAMQSSVDDILSDYGNNAHLNQFFAGGAQGFAQSLCLAAFGYDFPLGADFIQDAAYSFATKTHVSIFPSNREFTNYNPKDLTSVHNYEVAAVIVAGCKINNYNTYLKCIGSEDYGHPGVDTSCSGEGCDCLNVQTDTFESSRIWYLDGGNGYGVNNGEVVDIKLQSPQKIDSVYRYDHVVVEIDLDPNENVESCFAEGYRTDTGGIFYQPIRDVSSPGVISCQVDYTSGKYMCPEIGELFYGEEGLAYLESPYIECRDPITGEFESCGTPNMLLQSNSDKDLIVKPYVFTDGGGYCMKIKVSGSGTDYGTEYVEIQEGLTGTLAPSINIGEISDEMFGVYSNDLKLNGGNAGCEELSISTSPSSVASGGSISFNYRTGTQSDGVTRGYRVEIPTGVTVNPASGYDVSSTGNYLVQSSNPSELFIELSDINAVNFEYNGFEFSNILGAATSSGTYCKYKVQVASSGSSRNEASIGVEVSLYQKPEDSSCLNAKIPVTSTALGASSKKVTLVVQKESTAIEGTSDINSNFLAGDYEDVIVMATTLIADQGTMNEVEGIYYYVASLIQLGSGVNEYQNEIINLLDRFFFNVDASGNDLVYGYDSSLVTNGEFVTIKGKLCQIAEQLGEKSRYADGSTTAYDKNAAAVSGAAVLGAGTSEWGCDKIPTI